MSLASNPRTLQGLFNLVMQELDTNVIIINNFQLNTVRQLIQFIYINDYNNYKDKYKPPGRNAYIGNSDEINKGKTIDFISQIVSNILILEIVSLLGNQL